MTLHKNMRDILEVFKTTSSDESEVPALHVEEYGTKDNGMYESTVISVNGAAIPILCAKKERWRNDS